MFFYLNNDQESSEKKVGDWKLCNPVLNMWKSIVIIIIIYAKFIE